MEQNPRSQTSLSTPHFRVVYLDLNFFKAYNDSYGYESGDKVLLFTAKLTGHMVKRYGGRGAFVGHLGGDDFILLLEPQVSDSVCGRLTQVFDRVAPRFHRPEERTSGKMQGHDRSGNMVEFPLLSVALGVVDVLPAQYESPEEISRAAARAKQKAKVEPGSRVITLDA